MPRKKQKKKADDSYGGYVFANLSLASTDKDAVQAWIADNEQDFFQFMDTLLLAEYTFKFSHSDSSNSYVVSLTGTPDNTENAKVILTSHADTPFEALGITLYKHIILCGDGEWPLSEDEERWG